jgi:hypothetical protein
MRILGSALTIWESERINPGSTVDRIGIYQNSFTTVHHLPDILLFGSDHSLPGGTKGLDIGEAVGHYGWYCNETALDYSLKAVDALIPFVQHSDHPDSYSVEPISEAADNRNFSSRSEHQLPSKWLL